MSVNARRILRRREVEARTGLSRSTIYSQMAEGAFPKGFKIGKRARGWTEESIVEWQEAREAADGE